MQRLFDIITRLGRGKAAALSVFGRSGALKSMSSLANPVHSAALAPAGSN